MVSENSCSFAHLLSLIYFTLLRTLKEKWMSLNYYSMFLVDHIVTIVNHWNLALYKYQY